MYLSTRTGQHATNVPDVSLKHRNALVRYRGGGKVYLRHALQDRVDDIGIPHEDRRVQAVNGRRTPAIPKTESAIGTVPRIEKRPVTHLSSSYVLLTGWRSSCGKAYWWYAFHDVRNAALTAAALVGLGEPRL